MGQNNLDPGYPYYCQKPLKPTIFITKIQLLAELQFQYSEKKRPCQSESDTQENDYKQL